MSGETEDQVSGWTTDTALAHLQTQLDDLKARLDERYSTQVAAVNDAFAAQQTAMRTAFEAADKAVDKALEAAEKAVDQRANTLDREFHEHLEQVRHENALAQVNSDKAVQAALASAEKAVNKAEAAAEKRFEMMNEFRGQLSDQATTFVTRVEADAINSRNTERIADLGAACATFVTRSEAATAHDAMTAATRDLADRINRMEGSDHGAQVSRSTLFAAVGAVVAILGMVIVFSNYVTG